MQRLTFQATTRYADYKTLNPAMNGSWEYVWSVILGQPNSRKPEGPESLDPKYTITARVIAD